MSQQYLHVDEEAGISVAMLQLAPGVYEVTQWDMDAELLIERKQFTWNTQSIAPVGAAMDHFDLIVHHLTK